jgi:hypothetical protein
MVDTIDTEYIELTATTGSDLDPELAAWFDEAIRLFVEASSRASAGSIRSALSSLAAVPRVHGLLVESCAELLAVACEDDMTADSPGPGLYL